MANTNPIAQRERNERAKAAVTDLQAHVIGLVRACCLPLAATVPGDAHRPDMCMKCRDRVHFLRARTW